MSHYILVLYYSRTGAVKQLAEAVATGIESTGVEARMRTVAPVSFNHETTAPAIPATGDLYCTPQDLAQCAGLALGSPTRFGNMAAPLKYFLESTSDIWASGQLIDKPAGVFTSSSSQHGGQESTLLTMLIPLLHHGMVLMGVPYSVPELTSTVSGGGPYGASHVHNEQQNSLSQDEYNIAFALGRRIAVHSKGLSHAL